MSSENVGQGGPNPNAEIFTYPSASQTDVGTNENLDSIKLAWAQPAPAKPTVDVAAAEQREKLSWKRGLDEGKAAMHAECAQQIARTEEQIGKALRDFARDRQSYFDRVEVQVVQLTLAIARKVLHREAQVDPLLLTGVLRVALERIGTGASIRLRTNPGDIKRWQQYFAQNASTTPVPELIGDTTLEPWRCILETDQGTTEIGIETQLKEIELGFLDLMAQRPDSA